MYLLQEATWLLAYGAGIDSNGTPLNQSKRQARDHFPGTQVDKATSKFTGSHAMVNKGRNFQVIRRSCSSFSTIVTHIYISTKLFTFHPTQSRLRHLPTDRIQARRPPHPSLNHSLPLRQECLAIPHSRPLSSAC